MTGCGDCPEYKYLLTEAGERIELDDGSGYILLEDQLIGKTSSPWKSKGSVFLMFMFGEYVMRMLRGMFE